jgi:hypothetical protein
MDFHNDFTLDFSGLQLVGMPRLDVLLVAQYIFDQVVDHIADQVQAAVPMEVQLIGFDASVDGAAGA